MVVKTRTYTTLQKWVIAGFLSVPLLSSLVSMYHLVDFFSLGNPSALSIALAITFEFGSIAGLMAMTVLKKARTSIIWVVISILFVLQVIGNVYFSFDWISNSIAADGTWIANFQELFSWAVSSQESAKTFLAWIIGLPIALIGVLLSKALVDYLETDETVSISENLVTYKPDPDYVTELPKETSEPFPLSMDSDTKEILPETDPENSTVHDRPESLNVIEKPKVRFAPLDVAVTLDNKVPIRTTKEFEDILADPKPVEILETVSKDSMFRDKVIEDPLVKKTIATGITKNGEKKIVEVNENIDPDSLHPARQ